MFGKLGGDGPLRLVLSLFFRAVLGIERIFHFETLDDAGFALLTGGARALSRTRLGGLVRAVSTRSVNAFARATETWGRLRDQIATLSLDEHVVARFTRKFRIQKGFHTIRNKHMRSEKLFFLYWPAARRFLLLVSTRAKASLGTITTDFVRAVRARARPKQLRLVLDAGAANSHAALARLDRQRATVFLIRAPRRPASVRAWKRLPAAAFQHIEEPGRYTGAPPKSIHITETTSRVAAIARPVRTIVVREDAARDKERWHALFILHDATSSCLDLLHEFRTRQHHEQGYRIGVHDMALDTVPSGYPKSGRPDRPGFRRGPITLCAWIGALAWDALRQLGLSLPRRFHLAHPRTLRRWVLVRNAELLLSKTHLFVVLESARGRSWLLPLLRRFNLLHVTIPWLDGRRIAIGFAKPSRYRESRGVSEEAGSEHRISSAGVWC
jgi:hypothetical protein